MVNTNKVLVVMVPSFPSFASVWLFPPLSAPRLPVYRQHVHKHLLTTTTLPSNPKPTVVVMNKAKGIWATA